MYWLHTTNEKYLDCTYSNYHFLPDAMIEYHRLIKVMMEELPKEQWFDLKLMRHGKDGDLIPEKDHVVRSWVY